MQIGILQCGHLPDEVRAVHGDYGALYERLLAGHDFGFRTYSVVDMEFPEGPEAADGWLISGSRFGAYDDQPFIAPLEDFIRNAHAARVPVVGICFGHQIIAQALGGKVEKFDGGWAVGRKEYDFGGRHLGLTAWHQDQVVTPPPAARTVAANDFCTHAALAYDSGPVYSVQPHPEFDVQFGRDLLNARAEVFKDMPQVVADATEGFRRDLDNDVMAGMIADFLLTHKKKKVANG